GPTWPQGSDTWPTTSGSIYVGNLDGQIEAMQRQLRMRPDDDLLNRLARAHYHRFQISGQLDHAVEARSLLSRAYQRNQGGEIALSYAEVLTGFHEYELALEVLASVQQNGADSGRLSTILRAIRRDTELPQGHADEAEQATPAALVGRAQEHVKRGQIVTATRLLKQAQDSYQKTAPYMLAWIHVQQGIIFLRYQDYASARLFFAAAHQRLPQYAVATEHLAETELALGNISAAEDLYRAVAEQTDNPEFYYQLALATRANGKVEEAERLEQRAAQGYKSLLDRYPLMWADHAARYYLAIGDMDEALRLARMNIDARKNLRARTLMIEANQQAGNLEPACKEFAALRRAGYASPELVQLEPALQLACN
ncbi:MAG: hypothetical protein KJP04_01160, partial [Arenicella sp.]|nr:hypothetical protein [Arenicella sp.]